MIVGTISKILIGRERTSVVEDIMGMQMAQLQTNYSYGLMKRAMNDAESQAMSLINDMMAAVPAPAQYNFDVWA